MVTWARCFWKRRPSASHSWQATSPSQQQRAQSVSLRKQTKFVRKDEDHYILVDGYHRYTVLKTSQRIYKRENGLLPIVVIDKDLSNRMSSTIRHNRARGMHNIELMCNIVAELDKAGMSDQWIMKNIGMDRDELLRLKQISGLADLFANREFSIPDEVAPTETERKTL